MFTLKGLGLLGSVILMTIKPKKAAANVAQFKALKASSRLSMLPIRMRITVSDAYKEVQTEREREIFLKCNECY